MFRGSFIIVVCIVFRIMIGIWYRLYRYLLNEQIFYFSSNRENVCYDKNIFILIKLIYNGESFILNVGEYVMKRFILEESIYIKVIILKVKFLLRLEIFI